MDLRNYLLVIFLGLFPALDGFAADAGSKIVVYKSPTCGCCTKWIDHLEQNGFNVEAHDVKDVTPYKIHNLVTPELASCHTAIVDGYVIEGHVPASDIKRLIREHPPIHGLAVPGMPVGSPGMEQGNHKDNYNVISFDRQGNKWVYSSH